MKICLALVLSFLLLTLKSCVVYSPQTVDIPLIHRKKDFRFDGGISLSPPAFNTTLSYGLTHYLAAQLHGSIWPASSESRHYFQGALGYYQNLRGNKVMEIYAGAGTGHGYTPVNATGGSIDNDYTSIFTQFNLGKISNPTYRVAYGAGLKVGFLQAHLVEAGTFEVNSYNRQGALLEPSVFLRTGGKRVKVNFKISGCLTGVFDSQEAHFPYSIVNAGVSLNVR